ncbi:trihelix transcription factor ASIL1-like [Macadamia integrifolia]|uniref:trihelix transcription factor ASIL1-like n=1 Tax=Macadamia integrifolia TaxID=60698 RepID=UPI001C4F5261|nr:trihelix transcription factor ASIL1-like [Macadamia integrifolia]XP_042505917.1 trihelix transcription factor ASIL1-like [Macadamia integrifolia]XP_042505918.1 trihelix transcription factor ASIL1-like [Macadamia integrifolia]XP_042505919.1 trihelix transcription factor ASIL1-like [Macadamia integrifolia]XP_042505920.1 trihelix transcription factor ASIL1-like [Macadamia integrifolia]XP_042505921.1 trihelix transcription factor ASIL1-like [Macadamia integrifolia]
MDDTEDDARYPPNHYPVNYHQNSSSSHRPKLPVRNASYSQPVDNEYGDEDDEEEEQEEEEEEQEEQEEEEEEEEEEEDEDEENDAQRVVEEAEVDEDDEDDDEQNNYHRRIEADGEDSERHRKKRKLKNLALGYEFAPRVAAPSAAAGAPPAKQSFGARNSPADWTEHGTFVLLDAWGDRFLQLGRKSLRSDEWHEVANKVSEESNVVRTDTQCRNRLDTLKKKYKKEKMRLAETGSNTSKWVYFKKMDMLMTASPRQPGLSCGLDSGEYVFMNPRVYLNRSNGLDEMRDSPGNSESANGNEDDSDGLPPRRTRFRENGYDGSSFRLLANSIQKFGEIYEKIENSKRQQMLELEKMRVEFHRDLELQKRQILERAQAEIAKIRQGDDEDTDDSAENSE